MRILAIDPGQEKSAYVDYKDGEVLDFGILQNAVLLSQLPEIREAIMPDCCMACEMIASYGMAVGKSVFETCVWIGRFVQAWGGDYRLVYRREVKLHLCGSPRAKDANIRQAIMDRYGSTRVKALGTKNNPGPLYGVRKDVWAALGVAITADHLLKEKSCTLEPEQTTQAKKPT